MNIIKVTSKNKHMWMGRFGRPRFLVGNWIAVAPSGAVMHLTFTKRDMLAWIESKGL